MSDRDDKDDRGSDGTGASPYDEPTGSFAVPPVSGSERDRDDFYDRYAAKPLTGDIRRVDDLDDLDPGEVETTAMGVPAANAPTRPFRRRTPAPVPPVTDPEPDPDTIGEPAPTAVIEISSEPDPALPAPDAAYAFVDDQTPEAGAPVRAADAAVLDDTGPQGRGTLDLGLLLLRVAVGVIAMAHGMQKLFGWWNGPRLSGFEDFLVNGTDSAIGFDPDVARPLAIIGALSETLGGVMLVLGLLTPIGASAVLGVMIIAATFKATLAGGVWFFATGQAGPGIEYELLLAVCAAAIILCGPGRISLDAPRGWARRPLWGSLAWLIIGIAVAVAVWIVFNGTNPFTSPGDPAG